MLITRELKRLLKDKISSAVLVQVQQERTCEYRNRHPSIYHEFRDVLVDELSPGDVSILPPVRLTLYPDARPGYQQPDAMSSHQRTMVEEKVQRLLYHG